MHQALQQLAEWWPMISQRVEAIAQRYGLSRSDADDVVQDVAARAVYWAKERAELFRDHGTFLAMCLTTARYCALDKCLALKKDRKEYTGFLDFVRGREPTPVETAITQEMRALLLEGIAILPEHQQAVMTARLKGESDEEVARVLGVKAASVRSLRRYATDRLAIWLSGRDDREAF